MAGKIKLIKRGDTYKPVKLRASLHRAGASPKVINEVMKSVKVRSGMSTLQLRKQVTALLKKFSPQVAVKYSKRKKRR